MSQHTVLGEQVSDRHLLELAADSIDVLQGVLHAVWGTRTMFGPHAQVINAARESTEDIPRALRELAEQMPETVQETAAVEA